MPSIETSSHRALNCFDILHLIFQHLSIPPYSNENREERLLIRGTLASSARVCRAFSEHALDVLWESLDASSRDILPALKLLPPFLVVWIPLEDLPSAVEQTYLLLGKISPCDWARFQYYARRVRRIEYSAGTTLQARSYILEVLFRHNQQKALFPFLKHLSWEQFLASDRSILTLVTPSLRTLSIGLFRHPEKRPPEDSKIFKSLLVSVSRATSNLRYFDLFGAPLPARLRLAVASWRQLQTLVINCDYLTLRLLRELSALEHLVELRVNVWNGFRVVDVSTWGGLTRLQKLTLRGIAKSMLQYMPALVCASLHTLIISVSECGDLDDYQNCIPIFTLVSSKCMMLREVELTIARTLQMPFLSLIGPLTSLHLLEKMTVTISDASCIVDADISDLATAWPALQEFIFFVERIGRAQSISPRALVEFARRCPNLRKLHLPRVAFGSEALLPAETYLGITAPGVHAFVPNFNRRCRLRVKDPVHIARFIGCLFPNFNTIDAMARERRMVPHVDGETEWAQVLHLLAMSQANREQQIGADNNVNVHV